VGRVLLPLRREPTAPVRFPILFGPVYAGLSRAVLLPPSSSFVEIDGDEVRVRMGWAFRARFPRSAVRSAAPSTLRPLSRGVHGQGGRWLVNGSAEGLVELVLDPRQRAYVLGFPVALRQLIVSVETPAALTAALVG
jgi:hypothetical protein